MASSLFRKRRQKHSLFDINWLETSKARQANDMRKKQNALQQDFTDLFSATKKQSTIQSKQMARALEIMNEQQNTIEHLSNQIKLVQQYAIKNKKEQNAKLQKRFQEEHDQRNVVFSKPQAQNSFPQKNAKRMQRENDEENEILYKAANSRQRYGNKRMTNEDDYNSSESEIDHKGENYSDEENKGFNGNESSDSCSNSDYDDNDDNGSSVSYESDENLHDKKCATDVSDDEMSEKGYQETVKNKRKTFRKKEKQLKSQVVPFLKLPIILVKCYTIGP